MPSIATLQDQLDRVAALAKTDRTRELDEFITQLRTHFSDHAESLKSLAFLLNQNDRFSDAVSVAKQGLALDPLHPLLHHNAARALGMLGNVAESLVYSREAVRLLPDNPYMHFHLAGTLLGLGKLDEGWQHYRWFYDLPGMDRQLVRLNFPQWRGESLTGRTFLLVGEQGRGDEIQFIRFAEWLHRQGAIVDVLVSQPIAGIAASIAGVRAVFTTVPPGAYDYWSHMLKMPEHMKLNQSMLPIATRYIAASPDKLAYWRAHVDALPTRPAHAKTRRMGVVWAGGPHHVLDRFRSIRLDALKPLFALPGTSWYSVQKGDHECESEALADEFDLHTLGPAIQDFTDTLAILETLDLLITVDTSVAHLAGAAGRPVWVLLPTCADWRWMVDRTDTPWYPSMRLFRQRELGQWDEVIEEVRNALREWQAAR